MGRTSIVSDNCKCQNIPVALLHRIARRSRSDARMLTDSAIIETLYQLIKYSTKKQKNLDHLCYAHMKSTGGHIGLQTKLIKRPELQSRLEIISRQSDSLDQLRSQESTHLWFRKADKPAQTDDDLGIYAFRPATDINDIKVSDGTARAIVNDACGSIHAFDQWEADGNLIVRGMFSWLFDGVSAGGETETGVGPLIEDEFLMYAHHQREINGKPNRGWLRNMIHSITQQLIRQDLGYYTLYVALRPDRSPTLVSYPYYTKFAKSGDSTAFRHIDLNVPRYIQSGRGRNIIQGSVSLDNETVESGCTEIVPGFHKHLEDWWTRAHERLPEGTQNKGTGGWVHDVSKLWSSEDGTRYGDFIPVPCQRGDVRVTKPEIVHGSTATTDSNAIRRTILPWYVGVQKDGVTLDNDQSETWLDLCAAYAQGTETQLTPSGHPVLYGRIPFRFPAQVQMVAQSPVSRAIQCQTSWTDPAAVNQAALLLGPDRAAAIRTIQQHRIQALRDCKAAFKQQEEAERKYFGPNSYFRGLRSG